MEPGDDDRHYSETLLRLPGLGCWFDPAGMADEPLPSRPANSVDGSRSAGARVASWEAPNAEHAGLRRYSGAAKAPD
jgi:hypothetical protein